MIDIAGCPFPFTSAVRTAFLVVFSFLRSQRSFLIMEIDFLKKWSNQSFERNIWAPDHLGRRRRKNRWTGRRKKRHSNSFFGVQRGKTRKGIKEVRYEPYRGGRELGGKNILCPQRARQSPHSFLSFSSFSLCRDSRSTPFLSIRCSPVSTVRTFLFRSSYKSFLLNIRYFYSSKIEKAPLIKKFQRKV